MFENIRIRSLLLVSFTLIIVSMIGVGLFATYQMGIIAKLTTNLYHHPFTVTNAIRDIHIVAYKIRTKVKDVGVARNLEELEKFVEEVNSTETELPPLFALVKERFLGNQQDVDRLIELFESWKVTRDKTVAEKRQELQGGTVTLDNSLALENITSGELAQQYAKIKQAMTTITDFSGNKAKEFINNANSTVQVSEWWTLLAITLATFLGIVIIYFVPRAIVRPLEAAIQIAERIAQGNLNNQIEIRATNEMGRLLHSLAGMQTQLREKIEAEARTAEEKLKETQARMEQDRKIANEALRINSALENATTCVLITDNSYHIIYINQAAKELFLTGEAKIRQEISNFNSAQLLGKSIDFFHKDPSHQRRVLSTLTGSRRARVTIGGLTLDHIITPVINDNREQVGIIVEFHDRTLEIATEQEINAVIQAASQGNFKERIYLDNKVGFFRVFSESINQILTFVQGMIEEIMRVLAALAEGDLTQKVESNYAGALEQLKEDANTTVDKLTEIMLNIRQTSEIVSRAAEEISQGNTSLSQRTEEQAASLEQTAASIEQMTSAVQQSADNSSQAAQLAISARDRATQGGIVVDASIQAINEINQSSKKITDIIGVIDEIAFQTNLLALNAAVEAARAGEQGRGFAVVATEVRNLAQRSATAAKEIKGLIQDSVTKVQEGTRLANKSGETLEEIVIAVKKVSDIIAEIAAANQEQSSGINQVNRVIAQLDEMTQQNASLVEEAAAASESMNQQARMLKQQVTFFKLGDAQISSTPERTTYSHHVLKAEKPPRNRRSRPATKVKAKGEWEDF